MDLNIMKRKHIRYTREKINVIDLSRGYENIKYAKEMKEKRKKILSKSVDFIKGQLRNHQQPIDSSIFHNYSEKYDNTSSSHDDSLAYNDDIIDLNDNKPRGPSIINYDTQPPRPEKTCCQKFAGLFYRQNEDNNEYQSLDND